MAVAYRIRERHDVYHVSYGLVSCALVFRISRDPLYHMSPMPHFQELSCTLLGTSVNQSKKNYLRRSCLVWVSVMASCLAQLRGLVLRSSVCDAAVGK